MNVLYLIRGKKIKKKSEPYTHSVCVCVCECVCDTKPKPSIGLSPKKKGVFFFSLFGTEFVRIQI